MKPDDTNEALNGLRSVHSQTIAKLSKILHNFIPYSVF